jgi:pre-mRNA-splicing factor CWC22
MAQVAGVYLPPFKLARIKEELVDPSGEDAQRLEWERLRKSLKGMINRVNSSNIKSVIPELFRENLVKGRGLFVRSVLHAQIASPVFTPVLAALVAVVNTKIPDTGDLLVRRVVLQFRRAFMRRDEVLLSCVCKFLAHLFNQRVVSEIVILQVVTTFLEKLSSDSMKICCQLLFECGEALSNASSKGMFFIFERLRQVLQEGLVDKRVQYVIESLFDARKYKFAAYPAIPAELDLVEEDDQVTHEVDVIEGELDGEENLNIFAPIDPESFEKEARDWDLTSREILGITDDEEHEEEEYMEQELEGLDVGEVKLEAEQAAAKIADMTEQDMISLRKTIYLAISSSANFEESVHKLLSLNLRNGQEREVITMIVDACANAKNEDRFFHFQAERLCRLSRMYKSLFEESFCVKYEEMHRYETWKIRNLAKLFSHVLVTDAISWEVFGTVRLTEQDTTASTRIFLKILFNDLGENMGSDALFARVRDERLANAWAGIFPQNEISHIRFSVNFFTAIGMGYLTAQLRQRINELTVRDVPKQEIRERSKSPVKRTVISRSRSPSFRRQRRRRSESRDRYERRRERSRSVDSFGRRRR